jgi:hypothetical protein
MNFLTILKHLELYKLESYICFNKFFVNLIIDYLSLLLRILFKYPSKADFISICFTEHQSNVSNILPLNTTYLVKELFYPIL